MTLALAGSNPASPAKIRLKGEKMYIIRSLIHNQYFCKNHNEVIVFDNQNDINFFLQNFQQYCMMWATQDLSVAFEVMELMQNISIVPLREKYEFKIVYLSDIKKEHQKK